MEFIEVVIYISIYLGLFITVFYFLSYLDYLRRGKKEVEKKFPKNKLPKVSILIPAYNEEKSIARTLDSILKVNYPRNKFEIIVINNNSKDKTLEEAKKYEKKGVRVYTETRQGKGCALNFGISKAKGDIIFTMDADTFVTPNSVKDMVQGFADSSVMAVTPAMRIHDPRTIWQRIQYVEYLVGIYLRKVFASLNSVWVTPGAFCAYRKEFFEKFGGYDEDNITEDAEITLRIQKERYKIKNYPEACAYTIAPRKFKELLVQRRRWYAGHAKNFWQYRCLFGRKYGDLGTFVLPVIVLTILFSVFITVYLFFKTLSIVHGEVAFLKSINYDFSSMFDLSYFYLERFFFLLLTNPLFLFVFIFLVVLLLYSNWAMKRVGGTPLFSFNFILFFFLFSVLFAFWWVVAIIYVISGKAVKWR